MSGAKLYTLAAGEKTNWIDFRPYATGGLTFQGTTSGGGVATLETCNSTPSSETASPDDVVAIEAFPQTQFSRVVLAPMPNFGRIKNTAGAGTVKVAFGRGLNGQGDGGQVAEYGIGKGGPSNELTL